MVETPTAATMRLDGGHPAIDLVNTVYAQVGGPVEHDVLSTPEDLETFARRVGAAGAEAAGSPSGLTAARALRAALDPLLRAHLLALHPSRTQGSDPSTPLVSISHPTRIPGSDPGIHVGSKVVRTATGEADLGEAVRAFEAAVGAAQGAARLAPGYAWVWDDADPLAPVHRLAHAAAGLLTGEDLTLLHCCAGCCWLFLDRSRGAGRRWCSMADCGTEAKKRRYVERRRERRRAAE